MANIKSAKKAARQAIGRRDRNTHYRSTMRSKVKRVRTALQTGDAGTAQNALREAMRYVDRVASKGVIHRRTAARQISRLSKAVDSLVARASS